MSVSSVEENGQSRQSNKKGGQVRGKMIVFEGVDGTGKTTLAKLLASRAGYEYIYCPPPLMAEIRKQVEQQRNFDLRFYYYLTCAIALQPIIEERLMAGKNIVVDRYVYSTFAMHKVLGVRVDAVDMRSLPIRWPDRAVLLVARHQVRTIRCKERGDLQIYDRHIEQSTELLNAAQKVYMEYNDFVIIDTSDRSVEDVYLEVEKNLV